MNLMAHAIAANDPLALHVREARRLAHWGLAVLVCGLLPAAAWLSFAPLSSAVVAQAYVKVDLNRRPVQHAEGGIVREVLVRDGQHVRQGEPLLVLGDVSVDADRNRLDHRVKTERASLARLDAEQTMARAIAFPPDVVETAAADPRLAAQLNKENALFEARRDALVGQVRLLRSQREKVAEEIVALRAQIMRASESMTFQKNDLETNRKLLKDGFISAARIAQLEGTVADYGVKIEERRAELARAEQRTVDADLRIRSLESEYRQQASDQLKVTAARLAEIEQERRKSTDASARQVITAPASGEIIDLKYSTPGAVIPPRETIADVVPDDTRLVTDARVRPEDIGRIQRGQPAEIRFTAFKYRTTQLVHGKVVYVSGDRLIDRATGAPYYSVLVEADAASLATAGDLKLLAGMPAEIYLQGDERTALQYLVEPITQVLRRAARER
ncbi:HlyD family type I secretion periplasmic adaptor subunit [Variovorax paradoxus]|uniref:HlyD family type I secretion periplasmic adaptor subunit n=1 Tax=Variovorax paradoxus TaxID=34073 RepID=UPI002782EA4C|nr:HlyD family type I secretion periplasmic adaptor subunit [Variovorax paradoxus]MDP9928989.1 HlyD family secretion protein [Variovorax paradoxus]